MAVDVCPSGGGGKPEGPAVAVAKRRMFTGYEVSDFVELGVVFLGLALTLGLMVVFGVWWSR